MIKYCLDEAQEPFILFDTVFLYAFALISSAQFSPWTNWIFRGDMTDDSAENLFQLFLLEAVVSSSGMGREVHTLMLSVQHFLRQQRHNQFGEAVVACDMLKP